MSPIRRAPLLLLLAASFFALGCPPDGPIHTALSSPPHLDCPNGDTDCNNAATAPNCSTGKCDPATHTCTFTPQPGCQCVENDVQPCSVSGTLGPCVAGQKTCSPSGKWGPCTSNINPQTHDQCGAQDDENCDGNPHNGAVPNGVCQCISGTQCPSGTCVNGVCPPCNQGAFCQVAGVGECAHGSIQCPSAQCVANTPSKEVCDGKDNDCNGQVDDVTSTHDAPVTDSVFERGANWGGISDNTIWGPSDCGGTRVSATGTKLDGGDSHCEFAGWADQICTNPGQKDGNSDFRDACRVFVNQGGHPNAAGNLSDCRYMIHVGAHSMFSGLAIRCEVSHVVRSVDRCGG